jgi:hypothetical protein
MATDDSNNLAEYFHLKCYSKNKSKEKQREAISPPFSFCYGN